MENFSIPNVLAVENGGPSASGRHLGRPHSRNRKPGMRSSKMATGSWRNAIFHLHQNCDRKVLPKSWLTSLPAPPSWLVSSKMAAPQATSGGHRDSGEDVHQTSAPSSSSERGRSSPKMPCRYLTLLFYFSIDIQKCIWSLASPNHSLNDWGSCPLATTEESISLHVSTPRSMGSMKRGVDFGKHLLYFFLKSFLNCTLQYTRIIVEYSVIVGGSLVDSKPTSTPLWPFCFLSHLSQPSDNDRAVWVRGQFDSIIKVWCLGCRVQIMRRRYLATKEETSKWCRGQIVTARECPDCDSQEVQHQAPSTEQLLYSRLVLPPYTVRIRGGRLGGIIQMSSCPTTQHS